MNISIILIIAGAVLIVMAIIGYLAEKKGFGKKKEETQKVEGQVPEIEVNQENLTATDVPAGMWSEDAKPKDEHQETIHKVPTMDDWSSIPTGGDLPDVQDQSLDSKEIEDSSQDSEPMFPEINSSDLEIPEVENTIDTPVETLNAEEVASNPVEDTPVLEEPIAEPQNMDYSFDFSNQVAENTTPEPVETLNTEIPTAGPVETLNTEASSAEPVMPEPIVSNVVQPEEPALQSEVLESPEETPTLEVTPKAADIEPPLQEENIIPTPQPATEPMKPIEEVKEETQGEASIWN